MTRWWPSRSQVVRFNLDDSIELGSRVAVALLVEHGPNAYQVVVGRWPAAAEPPTQLVLE